MINNLTKIILTLLYYSQVLPGYDCRYSIVVDGGSTGTRMHIFNFNEQQAIPTLRSTIEIKNKVKLSSFSDNRNNWGLLNIMLNNLTNEALRRIPESSVSTTPFYIQSTAGVRQLPSVLGTRILTKIRQQLSMSTFAFNNNNVKILTSNEEGKYAWISVNFLLGKFTVGGIENTYGVIDLGGSSTQIAYIVDPSESSQTTRIFTHNIPLYSFGSDYMGINEIRLKLFGAKECSTMNCSGRFFAVPCLHFGSNYTYKYKDIRFTIGGVNPPLGSSIRYRSLHCLHESQKLTNEITFRPNYPTSTKFIAINAFYHIINNVPSILTMNPILHIKETTVTHIWNQVGEYCDNRVSNPTGNPYHQFICMDLAYLYYILRRYGMRHGQNVMFANKIQNKKLSWALGFAISKF